mmetsp:Transcript_77072/g.249413  ORF Transcript_77072/g.249413 Transcript_77072/m.249413 type:complete len:232 (+) Transcript_77072:742-1437(+)
MSKNCVPAGSACLATRPPASLAGSVLHRDKVRGPASAATPGEVRVEAAPSASPLPLRLKFAAVQRRGTRHAMPPLDELSALQRLPAAIGEVGSDRAVPLPGELPPAGVGTAPVPSAVVDPGETGQLAAAAAVPRRARAAARSRARSWARRLVPAFARRALFSSLTNSPEPGSTAVTSQWSNLSFPVPVERSRTTATVRPAAAAAISCSSSPARRWTCSSTVSKSARCRSPH